VPTTRGPEVSRHPDDLVLEVHELVLQGAREITLLGQNVNSYESGGRRLPRAARALRQGAGQWRLRFTTSHPRDMSRDVMKRMAQAQRLAPWIHLPVQSGSPRVLSSMNRDYTLDHYLEVIEAAREEIADLALTTDIIVGFPGETEAEFEETVALIERLRYDTFYVFKYSPRSGTAAARREDDVPPEVKQARLARLLEVQRRLSHEVNQAYVGRTLEVLVEGIDQKRGNVLARTGQNKIVVLPPGFGRGRHVPPGRHPARRGADAPRHAPPDGVIRRALLLACALALPRAGARGAADQAAGGRPRARRVRRGARARPGRQHRATDERFPRGTRPPPARALRQFELGRLAYAARRLRPGPRTLPARARRRARRRGALLGGARAFALGRPREARDAWRPPHAHPARGPARWDSAYLVALSWAQEGKRPEALAAYRALFDLPAGDAQASALYQAQRLAHDLQRTDEAEEWGRRLLASYPRSPEAASFRAEAEKPAAAAAPRAAAPAKPPKGR
jgi:hypothetical protein